MLRTLRQCCQDEYRQHGTSGVLRLWPALFIRAIMDMVAEQFSMEGGRQMQPIMRRSTILTYSAFVLFVLGYLTLMRTSDPVAPFNAVALVHPAVGIAYRAISISMDIATLAMLLCGGLVLFSIIKYVRASGDKLIKLFLPTRRHLGILGIGTLVVALCLTLYIVSFGVIMGNPPQIAGQPEWLALLIAIAGVFIGSALFTFVILLVSSMIALAVSRSDLGPRVFSLVRICMAVTLLALAISFGAALYWMVALWRDAPQFAMSDAGLGQSNLTWVILAVGAMVLALCLLINAFRQGTTVRLHALLHDPALHKLP
ncbi:hypothetical protein KDK_53410 [Dictyobacter kobayashii]|uniref:Uncharacterized protein n=2 Tax=Dictyobacter kobayashii TaxID=2014872 RepID=A0A402AR19_9CHLR|nr:hypothetical protein KDK_53410 [Dictyobacter kobayashii]